MRALTQRDRAHRAIAHALAALDALVHVGGRRTKASLRQRLNRANTHRRARVVFGTTTAVDADDRICTDGFLFFRLTAEELIPNTVAQFHTSNNLFVLAYVFWRV